MKASSVRCLSHLPFGSVLRCAEVEERQGDLVTSTSCERSGKSIKACSSNTARAATRRHTHPKSASLRDRA